MALPLPKKTTTSIEPSSDPAVLSPPQPSKWKIFVASDSSSSKKENDISLVTQALVPFDASQRVKRMEDIPIPLLFSGDPLTEYLGKPAHLLKGSECRVVFKSLCGKEDYEKLKNSPHSSLVKSLANHCMHVYPYIYLNSSTYFPSTILTYFRFQSSILAMELARRT